jgi:hypothetical protein
MDATAPLVYVGNGWSNPEKGIDPYAGLEVRGKVWVVQAGYPKKVVEQGLDASQRWLALARTERRSEGRTGNPAHRPVGHGAHRADCPRMEPAARGGGLATR